MEACRAKAEGGRSAASRAPGGKKEMKGRRQPPHSSVFIGPPLARVERLTSVRLCFLPPSTSLPFGSAFAAAAFAAPLAVAAGLAAAAPFFLTGACSVFGADTAAWRFCFLCAGSCTCSSVAGAVVSSPPPYTAAQRSWGASSG